MDELEGSNLLDEILKDVPKGVNSKKRRQKLEPQIDLVEEIGFDNSDEIATTQSDIDGTGPTGKNVPLKPFNAFVKITTLQMLQRQPQRFLWKI